MIKFKNVYLQYINEFYSLFDFNCEIKSNTLFVGDFFSGTSAIMRLLSKIDKNYKGDIFIDDINIKNIKDKEFDLAYLPEQTLLFKNKNILNNLYFPLKLRKINKNNAKNLIYSIFTELKNNNLYIFNFNNYDNIDKILNLKIKKLNISEQKIIALIRAVIRKPKYILLENFFENLNKEHFIVANFLINKLKETSIVIACEKERMFQFENFEIIDLSYSV